MDGSADVEGNIWVFNSVVVWMDGNNTKLGLNDDDEFLGGKNRRTTGEVQDARRNMGKT